MESNKINTFLTDISNQLGTDDLSLEEIIEILLTKIIDLCEAHFNSRHIFSKTTHKDNFKSMKMCPFDTECQENK